MTNAKLQSRLGWTKERYDEIRQLLVDEGRVIKGKGQGGSTARVVDEEAEAESPLSVRWRVGSYVAFGLAALMALACLAYVLWWRQAEGWMWNTLALLFGAVSLTALGFTLQIYRQQAAAAHKADTANARLLKKMHSMERETYYTLRDLVGQGGLDPKESPDESTQPPGPPEGPESPAS